MWKQNAQVIHASKYSVRANFFRLNLDVRLVAILLNPANLVKIIVIRGENIHRENL